MFIHLNYSHNGVSTLPFQFGAISKGETPRHAIYPTTRYALRTRRSGAFGDMHARTRLANPQPALSDRSEFSQEKAPNFASVAEQYSWAFFAVAYIDCVMFYKESSNGYREVLPSIEQKTLVYGERTLLTEFRMRQGGTLPRHTHPHEQTGYLIKGRIRLTIGNETFDAKPGDSWSIPSQTEHSAEIVEDSVALEVFSPVRTDYLPA